MSAQTARVSGGKFDETDELVWELVPADLDEATHAELRMAFEESAGSVRFAKAQQWKTLGATLLVLAGLLLAADHLSASVLALRTVAVISLAASAAAIYSLAIYQAWQNTEQQKLGLISESFSNLFRDIRATSSRREANFHRYALLVFMVGGVLLGETLLLIGLSVQLR